MQDFLHLVASSTLEAVALRRYLQVGLTRGRSRQWRWADGRGVEVEVQAVSARGS